MADRGWHPAVRVLGLLLPYLTVPVGLFLLESGWAAILLYHLGMAIVLTLGRGWSRFGDVLVGWRWRTGFTTLAVCAAAGPLIWLLWPFMDTSENALPAALARLGLDGPWWLAFALYYTLVNPWLEETYWRGFLATSSALPTLEDAFFSGYHVIVLVLFVDWPWALLCFAFLVGAAWLWRQVARREDGLAIPALSHLLADASIIGAAMLLR